MSVFYYIGYHGTLLDAANILLQSDFVCRKNEKHWLGQGIYLFKDYDIAFWWTKNEAGKKQATSKYPSVLKEEVKSTDEKVMDITTPIGFMLFQREVREFYEGICNHPRRHFKNDYIARCVFFDYVKRKLGLNIIVCNFEKEHPFYLGECISTKGFNIVFNEIQICLTDNSCIKSKSIAYPIEEVI